MRRNTVLLGMVMLMGMLPVVGRASDIYPDPVEVKEMALPSYLTSIEGISPYRVYQRDDNGLATISFKGTLAKPAQGAIDARIMNGSKVLRNWKTIGKAASQEFAGEITGVPTGGEYTVELRFPGGAIYPVRHILVGDLWVMAGQSNMDGQAKLVNMEEPSPMVHNFYMDDRWGIARDRLTRLNTAVDEVYPLVKPDKIAEALYNERYWRTTGASMGVRFGKTMYERTKVPVGLVACSRGGSSMKFWNPAQKDQGSKSIYGATLRRINAVGGKVAGILWYQGESDAHASSAPKYKENTLNLFKSFRQDLGDPNLPIIYVQLACFLGDASEYTDWNNIQEYQLELEKELPNLAMVAAADLSMSDTIHLNAISQERLGDRVAHQAQMLRFNDKKLARGPRPVDYVFNQDRTALSIYFSGVNGNLQKVSRVMGFVVESKGNVPITSTDVSGNRLTLHFKRPVGPNAKLWHGHSTNPAVNLKDAADLLVPIFGPVVLP